MTFMLSSCILYSVGYLFSGLVAWKEVCILRRQLLSSVFLILICGLHKTFEFL